MLAQERQDKIIEILNARGFVKVEDLVSILGVSDMTIRRDLEKCHQDGLLRKVHGGAIMLNVNKQEVRFEDKMVANSDAKWRIAEACANFVQNGMSVFLDSGTTNFAIAQALRARKRNHLKIISNDIRIISSLMDSDNELIIVGGYVQQSTGSAIGWMVDNTIAGLNMDIAFIGASSISERMDVTTPTLEKVNLKRIILANSLMSYLAVDGSKFRCQALYHINHLREYTGVVTNYEFSEAEQDIIRQEHITIIQV